MITGDTKALLAAAQRAAQVQMARNVIPVLGGLLIDAADGRVTFTGTDLDTWSCASCEAAVLVAVRALPRAADIIGALKACRGQVTLTLARDALAVTANGFRASLPLMEVGDFPIIAAKSAGTEMEGGIAALAACLPFTSDEEARYYLQGVCFDAGHAVATDGTALHAVPCAGGSGQIVPRGAIPSIVKCGGRLFLGGHGWRAESEGWTLSGKLIDGTFPDWQRIIPKDRGSVAGIDAADMLSAIDAASFGGKAKIIGIEGAINGLAIEGLDHDTQGLFTRVDLSGSVASPFRIAFGAGILRRAFTCRTGDVAITGGEQMWMLEQSGAFDGVITLVMPMRHTWSAEMRAAA